MIPELKVHHFDLEKTLYDYFSQCSQIAYSLLVVGPSFMKDLEAILKKGFALFWSS